MFWFPVRRPARVAFLVRGEQRPYRYVGSSRVVRVAYARRKLPRSTARYESTVIRLINS